MDKAFSIRPTWREEIPDVCCVDGSGRDLGQRLIVELRQTVFDTMGLGKHKNFCKVFNDPQLVEDAARPLTDSLKFPNVYAFRWLDEVLKAESIVSE